MRVLFCGGGTAGHVMPAIAMAQMIQRNFKNAEVGFVGRKGGNENRSITKSGYFLYTIDVMGIKRSISLKNIEAILKALKSSRKAKHIILNFKPDLVIGTGGYVCYPVIKKAQQMKIPTIIHESNVYPGMVTRILGKKCSKLLLNVEATKEYLKNTNNTSVVGNPLRSDFKSVSRNEARKALNIGKNEIFIVSFGGSLGSEVLNEHIVDLMYGYSLHTLNVRHIHSAGVNGYNKLVESFPRLCNGIAKCKIVPYIDDMPLYLRAADIVISRSGAMTLSELSCAEVAPILIPSPNVTANHQYANAKYATDEGGAIMIEEKDLTADSLRNAVEMLVRDSTLRAKLQNGMKKLTAENVEEKTIRAIKDVL